jgi:hypothetical protein
LLYRQDQLAGSRNINPVRLCPARPGMHQHGAGGGQRTGPETGRVETRGRENAHGERRREQGQAGADRAGIDGRATA